MCHGNRLASRAATSCPAKLALLLVTPAALGCPSSPSPPPAPAAAAARKANVTLAVAVVDDARLATAVGRLRGEWTARTGGTLKVERIEPAAVTRAAANGADVLVYPPEQLGQLAEDEAIIPVRKRVLRQNNYRAADVLPFPAQPLTAWDSRTMAVTLGTPVLVLYCRADLLDGLGHDPPANWRQYQRLVEQLRDRPPPASSTAPWHATLEPLAGRWAARTLLARAAPYVKRPGQIAVLFELDTMRPRIATPPFVRALDELRAAAAGAGSPLLDPHGVRQAFHRGAAALAISWPTAAAEPGKTVAAHRPVVIARLPGSDEVFSFPTRQWQPRADGDDGRVAVIGLAGRLASVTSGSRNAPTAFRFLAWLGGPELSQALGSMSRATTLFRRSHLTQPKHWVEAELAAGAAAAYTRLVDQAATNPAWIAGLRLPGADQYLLSLSAAVLRAVQDGAPAEASLKEAAGQWQAITDRLGRSAQAEAYRRGLGVE